MFFARQKQARKGEEAVEHQQLIAEVVVPEMLGSGVKGIAEQGRGEADIRYHAVVGLLMGKKTEGEKT